MSRRLAQLSLSRVRRRRRRPRILTTRTKGAKFKELLLASLALLQNPLMLQEEDFAAVLFYGSIAGAARTLSPPHHGGGELLGQA